MVRITNSNTILTLFYLHAVLALSEPIYSYRVGSTNGPRDVLSARSLLYEKKLMRRLVEELEARDLADLSSSELSRRTNPPGSPPQRSSTGSGETVPIGIGSPRPGLQGSNSAPGNIPQHGHTGSTSTSQTVPFVLDPGSRPGSSHSQPGRPRTDTVSSHGTLDSIVGNYADRTPTNSRPSTPGGGKPLPPIPMSPIRGIAPFQVLGNPGSSGSRPRPVIQSGPAHVQIPPAQNQAPPPRTPSPAGSAKHDKRSVSDDEVIFQYLAARGYFDTDAEDEFEFDW